MNVVLRLLFAILRSRIVWVAFGVVTAAGAAFVLTVAAAAAVVIAVRGEDVDPNQVAELATSLGLLAVAAATAAMMAAWRGLRQARVRRWLLLYEAMAAVVRGDGARRLLFYRHAPGTDPHSS